MEISKTPLYQKHIQANARISNFAGWALPLDYGSILQEAKHVRSECGVFDASHMGQILIEGKRSFDFFQRLTPNDISKTVFGQMQYNLFLNSSGGIIDDFMSYNLGEKILCVVNASNKDKVLKWLCLNNKEGVDIVDQSNRFALITIQGPKSAELARCVFGEKVFNLAYMYFENVNSEGRELLISRSGYTGEDGFEIYIPWDQAAYFWDKLISAGKDFELIPCGLGARDILRIEAGYPLYGHELDETINPYEASLGWAVKLNKDFISKDILVNKKDESAGMVRVGFVMLERAFPRQGQSVCIQDKPAGKITSGVFSPNIDKFIGMAYLEKRYSGLDSEIKIETRGNSSAAKVVKIPFIGSRTKRVKLV